MAADSNSDDAFNAAVAVSGVHEQRIGQGVLRRLLKARHLSRRDAGEAPGLPQHIPISPARAAVIAVSRTAEDLYGLPIQPLSIVPDGITLAEMSELLPEAGLFILVEGPGEALGVVAMDAAAITALIEVQALGRVTNRPIENRRRTQSDAAIYAEFVNRMLIELEREMISHDGFESFSGFRFVSHLDDSRPLLLMLEDVGYCSLRMNFRMGDHMAGRDAQFVVALPERRSSMARDPFDSGSLSDSAHKSVGLQGSRLHAGSARTGASLAPLVATAFVDLFGILCRRQLKLAEVQNLVSGKVITLPRVSLQDARLETAQGQMIAQGKLGELEGFHALRLWRVGDRSVTSPPVQRGGKSPEFNALIAGLTSRKVSAGPGDDWLGAQPPIPAFTGDLPISDIDELDQFRSDQSTSDVPPLSGTFGAIG